MAYDSDDDVLFCVLGPNGSNQHVNWRYCPTIGNPVTGTLTSAQIAAGCTVADDWVEDVVAGGVVPSGISYPGLVYDTVTKKVIQYGGNGSSTNQMWTYSIAHKNLDAKVRRKLLFTTPYTGGLGVNFPAMAYNPLDHKIYYRQASNTGAPMDWQYNPPTDAWTVLNSGTGPTGLDANFSLYMGFDPTINSFVTWSQPGTLVGEVWLGRLSANTSNQASACDINKDGVVNTLDVQIATNQALGLAPCGSADLIGNGVCSVIDVQRIVNAALWRPTAKPVNSLFAARCHSNNTHRLFRLSRSSGTRLGFNSMRRTPDNQ